jgi:dTDP-4-dehydrorhamnose reductase
LKVLVTGAAGQVGRALLASAPPAIEVVGHGRDRLDIASADAIDAALDESRFDAVINAAAYTAVDRAESEPDAAYAANATAVALLAARCDARRIRLIHISTDYVFDGTASRPYRTDDPTNPISIYGASKRQGELAIMERSALDALIVRSSWIYHSSGHNFVRTMLRLFLERGGADVVDDQFGTPTSAFSLARMLWQTCARPRRGVVHFTDEGVASWYQFAVACAEEGRAEGLVREGVTVRPIPSSRFPTAARRPMYSVLDKGSVYNDFGVAPTPWRDALREVLKEIARGA